MNIFAQSSKKSLAAAVQMIGRALAVAIVLGAVLTGLNQTAAVLGRAEFQLLPLILVFLTPFFVVTVSQILGIRAARRVVTRIPRVDEGLLSTILSHGIPLRAIILGLAAALVNSAIMTAEAMQAKQVKNLPIEALTAQLSAMFDRAALAISEGDDPEDHLQVLDSLIAALRDD